MKKYGLIIIAFLLLPLCPTLAQETTNLNTPPVNETTPTPMAEPLPVVIKAPANFTVAKAQISGISGEVVTIVYTSGKKKVYDPIMINPDTKVLAGTKPITVKNLKVRQYIYVTGYQNGEIIQGYEINTVLKKIPPKPATKKVVPVKKTIVQPIKKPVVKTPVKAPVKTATKK